MYDTFTRSFHLLTYRLNTKNAWKKMRAMVSVLQYGAWTAVSYAYSARDAFDVWGMSGRNEVKRVMDSTAPLGGPAGGNLGVDNASLRWTLNDRHTKNALTINSRFVGNLKMVSCIGTHVSKLCHMLFHGLVVPCLCAFRCCNHG
jgi:hypothetical protein